MDILLLSTGLVLVIWIIIKISDRKNDSDGYNRGEGNYDKGTKPRNNQTQPKKGFFDSVFTKKENTLPPFFQNRFFSWLPYDDQAITWCANLLLVEKKVLRNLLTDIPSNYKKFRLGKRSGGYRTISAPNLELMAIQNVIYQRILLPVNIHPAATGFRHKVTIKDNARPHLGKECILKTDIIDFFGSIKKHTVIKTFEKMGYPNNISKVLAELCCLNKCLPQGAPTSPALSNIVAYEMDKKLTALSAENGLTYTRYADDLTFSADNLDPDILLPQIKAIVREEDFALKLKKTKFLNSKRRKIITGISVSSGKKLTIPKAKKREIRKNVHFILTKGLAQHLRHIKSTDPSYLKRIIGYLNFWLSVEPDNEYARKSIDALKKIKDKQISRL